MAGTVTVTEENIGKIDKVTFTWASSTAGAASGTTTQIYAGRVKQVLIYAADTAPTDLYDVQVLDGASKDMLFGRGANCPVADEVVVEDGGFVTSDALSLSVTNAGDTKHGVVTVFIEE